MTILILANSGMGLYKFRKELICKLLLYGYKVIVSVPFDEYSTDLQQLGAKIINIDFNRKSKNPFKDFILVRKYFSLVNKYNPDCILTYTIKPNIYGGIVSRIKRIPFLPNITGLGEVFHKMKFSSFIVKTLYRISLKHATTIFFQNKDNQNYFEDNIFKNHNSILLPGSGVNIKEFKLIPMNSNNKIIFLFIGRIMKSKGIEEFLYTAKKTVKEFPNTEFWIIGPLEDNYSYIISEFEKNNVIKYFGEQKDIKPFLSSSSTLILPSYHEGMSNVVLEAASTGRPCLVSDIPGCREIIEDGFNGFLFESQNSESTYKAVRKYLSLSQKQRNTLGTNGRKKVEILFDREIIINQYLNQIKKAEKIYND